MPKFPRLDFKQLRDRVRIEDVCAMLRIRLKPVRKQFRGWCPICQTDSDRCFVVTPSLNRYWCFGGCQSGGDIIELVARVEKVTHKQAAQRIAEHFAEGS